MKTVLLVLIFIFRPLIAMSAVSVDEFKKIQLGLIKLYGQNIAELNGKFEIIVNRDGVIPQALSRKTSEGIWQIEVYQKMLDLKQQSPQTLGMMLCHEVGHFLGGEAYVVGRQLTAAVRSRAPKKMSCEGQADFFSTSDCFRKLAEVVPELIAMKDEESGLNNECYLSYSKQNEIDSCLSGLKTAKNLANVYQEVLIQMGFPTTFQNRFDPSVTDRTLNYVGEYPSLECRYQTLVHGLLCAEKEEGECMDPRWMRPLCWFKNDINNH